MSSSTEVEKKQNTAVIGLLGENISIMDKDENENLQIINYHHCDNESPDELKRTRGCVQEITTGKILFETFPYTEEYATADVEMINEKLADKDGGWDIFYSIEGALIRVFWHNNRWFISTNKKLNAFKSRWSSRKSFGEMFHEGLSGGSEDEDVLIKSLDGLAKDKIHIFLVRYNNENRIVCNAEKDPRNQLVFVGSWDDEKKILDRTVELPPILCATRTIKIEKDMTQEELLEFVDTMDVTRYQGVILFHKKKNIQFKIYSSGYASLYKARGNNPNIRFRYLEIRKDMELRQMFMKLYPLYQDMFLEYEHVLYEIAKMVRYYYIQRYIKNKYVTLPKEEYILMKKCHDWYLTNREENKINVTKVLDILNEEEVMSQYKMIRRFQVNQFNNQAPPSSLPQPPPPPPPGLTSLYTSAITVERVSTSTKTNTIMNNLDTTVSSEDSNTYNDPTDLEIPIGISAQEE